MSLKTFALRTKGRLTNKATFVVCTKCRKGVLYSVEQSRLRDALGHETYRCQLCSHTVVVDFAHEQNTT
jgi:DNA-directed RNA polymerase subunit M/transcription elongation factor TFIIS